MSGNKSLYSEHYLTNRLTEYAEYKDDSAALVMGDRLRTIYADKRPTLASANEVQTEEDFIKPVNRIVYGSETVKISYLIGRLYTFSDPHP